MGVLKELFGSPGPTRVQGIMAGRLVADSTVSLTEAIGAPPERRLQLCTHSYAYFILFLTSAVDKNLSHSDANSFLNWTKRFAASEIPKLLGETEAEQLRAYSIVLDSYVNPNFYLPWANTSSVADVFASDALRLDAPNNHAQIVELVKHHTIELIPALSGIVERIAFS